MHSENYFVLMQQLKTLARVRYMAYISEYEPDLPSSIFAWLFEKAIDLVDGIIQLHKSNLNECGQALIRVLFETYLKYTHLVKLMTTTSQKEASLFIIASIVLLKEKSTLQQDNVFPDANFMEGLGDLQALKNIYRDEKNPFIINLRKNNFLKDASCLDSIKKYGFLLDNIENIATKYGKSHEYQMMYRNFSRNVHANDLVEYFKKQDHIKIDDSIEARNIAAFDFVLRIFIEMMTHMDHLFSLQIDKQLNEIREEFEKL